MPKQKRETVPDERHVVEEKGTQNAKGQNLPINID